MPKKSIRKKLKEKLDKICVEYIRLRDDMTCQMCLKKVEKSNAHTSHVIPRSRGDALRWDENNLKLLCFHCHINVWHKNPMSVAVWFRGKFPERLDYIAERENITKKFSLLELEDMIAEYQDKIDDYLMINYYLDQGKGCEDIEGYIYDNMTHYLKHCGRWEESMSKSLRKRIKRRGDG